MFVLIFDFEIWLSLARVMIVRLVLSEGVGERQGVVEEIFWNLVLQLDLVFNLSLPNDFFPGPYDTSEDTRSERHAGPVILPLPLLDIPTSKRCAYK